MGYSLIHCCSRNGARKSRLGDECLDKISFHCHSGKHGDLDGLHRSLCYSGPQTWVFDRIPRCRSCVVHQFRFLDPRTSFTNFVLVERLCLEVVSFQIPFPSSLYLLFTVRNACTIRRLTTTFKKFKNTTFRTTDHGKFPSPTLLAYSR